MPIISMCGSPEVVQKGSTNPYIRTICRPEISGRMTSKVLVLVTFTVEYRHSTNQKTCEHFERIFLVLSTPL